ncbi:MAG: moaA [Phycisphaerales bacterium]|nr:moaA [Phycisphaerales bacterium]
MRLPIVESSAPRPPAFDTGPRSISAVRVLRISVTDRCNFRCLYCMPEEVVRWLPKENILTFEEIADIVKAAIQIHNIRRFKLTGGEPTVRHGIVELVRILRQIDGIEDLSLTTNGMLLEHLAHPLKDAGLDRVTISIDSLRPDRFKQITRTGDLATVLRGLDRCHDADLTNTKINCVTMRGTNDDEFPDFARLTLTRPLSVRFIEYMPLGDSALLPTNTTTPGESAGSYATKAPPRILPILKVHDSEQGPAGGCGAQDRGNALIPEPEVRTLIEQHLGPLLPIDRATESGVGPATVYKLANGNPQGRIGFISAMSAPFCATCNRLRLTADGTLRSCLFEGGEVDIRPILRTATDRATRQNALANAMTTCVRLKPEVHSHHGNQQMSRIGG